MWDARGGESSNSKYHSELAGVFMALLQRKGQLVCSKVDRQSSTCGLLLWLQLPAGTAAEHGLWLGGRGAYASRFMPLGAGMQAAHQRSF